MKVNDLVTISPHYSIKFANKVGRIKVINPKDGLSLKIQFTDGGQLYGFAPDEVNPVNN